MNQEGLKENRLNAAGHLFMLNVLLYLGDKYTIKIA
jgi:hypothetical protein